MVRSCPRSATLGPGCKGIFGIRRRVWQEPNWDRSERDDQERKVASQEQKRGIDAIRCKNCGRA